MARFGLLTAGLALVLSLLVLPWVSLPWWKIFRRCASIAAAIALWIDVYRIQGRSLAAYGWEWTLESRRGLLQGILVGVGLLSALLLVGLLTGACHFDMTADRAKLLRTVTLFVPGALLVGLLEELVFRGVLFQQLRQCSTLFGLVTANVLYAVVHIKTFEAGEALWRELVGLFLLGTVLAFTYLKTSKLAMAVGLHAVLAYGARVNKLLIAIPDSPWSWLTGTSRLVNGAAGWIGLGMLAVGLWAWRPRSSSAS